MTENSRAAPPDMECRLACERLVVGSYSLMDLGDYEECAALFAEDATWVRGGKPVTGRDAILAALNKRPEGAVTRHIVSNIFISQLAGEEASATAVFVPLRGPTDSPPAFDMVGDLSYRFSRKSGEWLITHLQPKPVFKA